MDSDIFIEIMQAARDGICVQVRCVDARETARNAREFTRHIVECGLYGKYGMWIGRTAFMFSDFGSRVDFVPITDESKLCGFRGKVIDL